MADPKYRVTTIPLNAQQNELLHKAQEKAEQDIGVELSRAQLIVWLCKRYIKDELPK